MSPVDPAQPLWSPNPDARQTSAIGAFTDFIERTRNLSIGDYRDLWAWSVSEVGDFWAAIWEFFELGAVSSYDRVLTTDTMPGATWFSGARVNFAEYLLGTGAAGHPAVISVDETGAAETLTWDRLRDEVAAVTAGLREIGVGSGDVVAGYLPNTAEAVIAFLATASLGAVWALVGLDYAAPAVIDRFAQLHPKVLIAASGYRYNGALHDCADAIDAVAHALAPSLLATVVVPRAGTPMPAATTIDWDELRSRSIGDPSAPVRVDFDDPLWVLFTSGTTGIPKGLVHSHGGILVELLKQLALQWNITSSDRIFWYTSTSWVMWNLQVSALLQGATIVCYDGSPAYPDTAAMWRLVETHAVTFFGTSPGYLHACAKAGVNPRSDFQIGALRALGCTGSPLAPDVHRWALEHVGPLPLWSMSGGTDVASAFCGGAPTVPIWPGELSAPCLGVAVEAWDEHGEAVPAGQVGELVITKPMPSMPTRLWNDADGTRYRDAYFAMYPNAWRQGDWITVTERGSVIIHGRSDATLNRNGIRMGSTDIYAAVEAFDEVAEALVVGVDRIDGSYWMPLFVAMAPNSRLDDALITDIKAAIGRRASPRHVPDDVIQVRAIPHTRTGKKLEIPVKRILHGAAVESVVSPESVDDASVLADFAEIAASHRPASRSGR
ncbi:acetoacetate--CoA ligase [Mycolicibacterium sp. CH28]|uniref:acetoacetate--CoA ligase n=1 Tax=Mycolicibacterium sp. CH28 TaxID=2512237 RepID=UPI0013869585|nr:acetoacetate--CoA ligase [Mycolicibacterium sp. CH28]